MNKKILFLFLGILLLGGFLRFYLITEIPPGLFPDEAVNGNNAIEALATKTFKIFYPENNGREGLFINLQAISIALFGNEPWALRVVSALFGTLTIAGVYLAAKELTRKSEARNQKSETNSNGKNPNDQNRFRISRFGFRISREEIIGLLSAFFLATSYWHVNFSRIGFRAILVPFFASYALYFLLKGLRRGTMVDVILAGVLAGLGFHTYIAFRFTPLVFAVPIIGYLYKYTKLYLQVPSSKFQVHPCTPCLVALFIFVAFVVALPVGWHFLQTPQDFFGRGAQVSIFSSDHSPVYEFVRSNLAAVAMLFAFGDCNPRHKLASKTELHPLVTSFFLIGLLITVKQLVAHWKMNYELGIRNYGKAKKNPNSLFIIHNSTLLVWLLAMSLPATLTREGLPHALRSIGMIPPVMILAGLGAWATLTYLLAWFEKQKEKWPERVGQLGRIQKEIGALFVLVLLIIPLATYRDYFIRWANSPDAYSAFTTDVLHIGQYLDSLPIETKKYVVVEAEWPRLREVGTPAQTVLFATDTFLDNRRRAREFEYLTRDQIENLPALAQNQQTIIALFNGDNRAFIHNLRKKFPELRARIPGDFVVLQNYE